MSLSRAQKLESAMMRAGQPQAILRQMDNDAEVEAAENKGAKKRGTLNEDSRRQHQSACFCNHDVPGTRHSRDLFLSNAWRRPDAQDRPTHSQRPSPAPRRQRRGSRKLISKKSRGERQRD